MVLGLERQDLGEHNHLDDSTQIVVNVETLIPDRYFWMQNICMEAATGQSINSAGRCFDRGETWYLRVDLLGWYLNCFEASVIGYRWLQRSTPVISSPVQVVMCIISGIPSSSWHDVWATRNENWNQQPGRRTELELQQPLDFSTECRWVLLRVETIAADNGAIPRPVLKLICSPPFPSSPDGKMRSLLLYWDKQGCFLPVCLMTCSR